jgi:hypothetical protein
MLGEHQAKDDFPRMVAYDALPSKVDQSGLIPLPLYCEGHRLVLSQTYTLVGVATEPDHAPLSAPGAALIRPGRKPVAMSKNSAVPQNLGLVNCGPQWCIAEVAVCDEANQRGQLVCSVARLTAVGYGIDRVRSTEFGAKAQGKADPIRTLRELVEAKTKGLVRTPRAVVEPPKVIKLMDALKRSFATPRRAGAEEGRSSPVSVDPINTGTMSHICHSRVAHTIFKIEMMPYGLE